MAMNVSLTPHEREQAIRFEQLKADVQKGIDDLDAGRSGELTDEVIEEIKARRRSRIIVKILCTFQLKRLRLRHRPTA